MRIAVFVSLGLVFLLGGQVTIAAETDENGAEAAGSDVSAENANQAEATDYGEGIGGNDQDASVMLESIQQRRTQNDSLFKVAPLQPEQAPRQGLDVERMPDGRP